MAERAELPEVLRQLIGKVDEPVILEVERGAIRRWADAIDDPNPLYHDVEYAKNSRYGELIAPPGFYGWPVKPRDMFGGLTGEILDATTKAGYPRLLDGGMAHEFFFPVRAGDTLVAVAKIADIAVRSGKAGKMVFTTFETTYTNQNGDVVARDRATMINLP